MELFSYFFKKEKKNPKPQQLLSLMLETKHDNFKTTFASCSIKLSKVAKSISSLNFKLTNMVEFSASLNNQ
jgi:hypothetical protein